MGGSFPDPAWSAQTVEGCSALAGSERVVAVEAAVFDPLQAVAVVVPVARRLLLHR